ncbi:MAG: DUF1223 domain-containing protein, partial [Thermoanaerobaculia bacterium]
MIAAVAAIESQAPRAGETPVVVELFTSQGCSSCPPADALLSQLARDRKVIALAYHVDYWNRLGWRDPFSSREWSQRQGEYVRAMKLASAYTPQIVVNGAREMVGSNSFAVKRAIEEESRRKPEGTITLTRTRDGVDVRAQSSRRDVELIVVTYENGATTKVESGENRGRTLANDAIVRSLIRTQKFEVHVPVAQQLEVAAVRPERGPRRIVAAAR